LNKSALSTLYERRTGAECVTPAGGQTAMTVFLVLSDKPNPALERKIAEIYPQAHYQLGDRQWAIAADKKTSAEVMVELGIKDGALGRAVVFRTAGAAGWFMKSLWEWLAVKEEVE
jgi:hypothetical protein